MTLQRVLLFLLWLTVINQSCFFQKHDHSHSYQNDLKEPNVYDRYGSDYCMSLEDIINVQNEIPQSVLQAMRSSKPTMHNGLVFQLNCNLDKKLDASREEKIIQILRYYIDNPDVNPGAYNMLISDVFDNLKKCRSPESFELFLDLMRMDYRVKDTHEPPRGSARMGIKLIINQIISIDDLDFNNWYKREYNKIREQIEKLTGEYPKNESDAVQFRFIAHRKKIANDFQIQIFQQSFDNNLIEFKPYETKNDE